VESLERDNHVGGGLGNPHVDGLFRPADPRIHRGRDSLPDREQLRHPASIARHGQLHVAEHAGGLELTTQPRQRRVAGGFASASCASANGTNARHGAGRTGTRRRVISVITPSVPSDPMNRSMRSMCGAAKYPADVLGTSGMRYRGTGTITVRSESTMSNAPS